MEIGLLTFSFPQLGNALLEILYHHFDISLLTNNTFTTVCMIPLCTQNMFLIFDQQPMLNSSLQFRPHPNFSIPTKTNLYLYNYYLLLP
jgi:hypothetical protein